MLSDLEWLTQPQIFMLKIDFGFALISVFQFIVFW